MNERQKQKIVKQIIEGANSYNKYLNNRKILILYEKNVGIEDIEICFKPEHFSHLTGVIRSQSCKAKAFFAKCISSKLSLKDFELRSDGTTVQKAEVLLAATQMPFNAKMIGPYARTGVSLYSEKLFGSTRYSIGAVLKNEEFVPNTLLNKDIRDIVTPWYKIVAIFAKDINDKLYNEYTFCSSDDRIINYCKSHNLICNDSDSWKRIIK